MPDEVYANGREISCKAGDGKSICSAFPDVCFTPPENPATPPGVPIPYPNTGMDSDSTSGSKTVKITGKEVMLKDSSYFKTSTGDEAGCAAKKGVITSVHRGKVYFNSWSMDVKFESENVVRHLDLTTHNHASKTGQTPTWPFAKGMDADDDPCKDEKAKEETACKEYEKSKTNPNPPDPCVEAGVGNKFSSGKGVATKRMNSVNANKCLAARRCRLVPFNGKPEDSKSGCCPAQTPDHIVPKSSFFQTSVDAKDFQPGWEKYKINEAPCMCLEGGSCSGSHGLRHSWHKAKSPVEAQTEVSFDKEVEHCAKSANAVAPQCSTGCLEAQLKKGHEGMGDRRKKIKHSPTGKNFKEKIAELLKKIKEMLKKAGEASP